MGNVAAQPRVHGATHNIEKIMEMVEDARPCIHIFVTDFPMAVAIVLIVVGIVGLVHPTH